VLFNSLEFAAFFLVFIIIFYQLSGLVQRCYLLVASLGFYGYYSPRLMGMLLAHILVNYAIATLMFRGSKKSARIFLILGLIFNLGILAFFKYANFLTYTAFNIVGLFAQTPTAPHFSIALPLAISFYTFHAISFLVDIHDGRIKERPPIIDYALYVCLFPHLIAGPIVRPRQMLLQFSTTRTLDWHGILRGIELVLFGLALKTVVADNLSPLVDNFYAAPATYSSLYALIAIVFFSFQIYGDFCGYSLMAIGFARIMGFRFGRNFNSPYFATSFSDFWMRWHISLSSWLRDYLYIRLGGNRGGSAKTNRNLIITMLLGGLWHGASFAFVMWGALHGLFLVLQRMFVGRPSSKVRPQNGVEAILSRMIVFVCVTLAWVPFRASDAGTLSQVADALVFNGRWDLANLPAKVLIGRALFFLTALIIVEYAFNQPSFARVVRRSVPFRIASALLCALAIELFGNFSGARFIYFEF
jgi:alginate O-acetyltransferase complex protein AlgI